MAAAQLFRATPCPLPAHVVDALLGELCVSLGFCLRPGDHQFVLANAPTDPLTFAELVVRLECGGTDDPKLVQMILPRVLRTFERAGDGGDDDAIEPLE